MRKHGLDFDIAWFKMPLSSFLDGGAPFRGYIGRGHLLIAYPAADGLLQVAWIIAKGTHTVSCGAAVFRNGSKRWHAM